VDGTIAEYDRVGDGERDYCGKAGRHGVNLRAITTPAGELIWNAPALPGRTADITAARTQPIITVCELLKIPVLADKACEGAGGIFCTPFKRHYGRELTAHPPERWPAVQAGQTRATSANSSSMSNGASRFPNHERSHLLARAT
jgi:hypothetical protein